MDSYTEMTLNLGYYVKEKIRVFAEYWTQLDVPALVDEDDRFTMQVELGF